MYIPPFPVVMPALLKISIGISQVLTMIELTLLLEISMKPTKQRSYERLIRCLRFIVAFICIGSIASYTIACIAVGRTGNNQLEMKGNLIEVASKLIGRSFLVLTIMLFLSISLVIWRLKVKQHRESITFGFNKEITNLLLILLVFSLSFLSRWIYDTFIFKKIFEGSHYDEVCTDEEGTAVKCAVFTTAVWTLGTQYVFDLIPIGAILLFHHHNYRDKRNSTRSEHNNDSGNEKKHGGRVEAEKHVLDLDVAQFLESDNSKKLSSEVPTVGSIPNLVQMKEPFRSSL